MVNLNTCTHIHTHTHTHTQIDTYFFHRKEEWYLNNAFSVFCNTAQSLGKEKKSQDSINSENDWKGTNQQNQQRKKKNDNTCSCSKSNNQHNPHKPLTNKPIKNDRKESFFHRIRPYKQRQQEGRLETVEIQYCDESETNNDQQNKYIIIVPNP